MPQSTLDPFDSPSRDIEARLKLYLGSDILEIDKSNFLISFSALNELGSKSSSSLLGDCTANELDIKLYNPDGVFSPSNKNSAYFGLMRAGVKVEVSLRHAGYDWIPIGTYFVTDWYAEVTSLLATISCCDKMQEVLEASTVCYVSRDTPYKEALHQVLAAANVQPIIDDSIPFSMPWWYLLSKTADTLNNLSSVCFAPIFCNEHGKIRVLDATRKKSVQHILTDHDQLISANVPQSLSSDFDGIKLYVNLTQLSDITKLLDIKDYVVPIGQGTSAPLSFSSNTVAQIVSIAIKAPQPIQLKDYRSSPESISLDTYIPIDSESTLATLSVFGKHVENTEKAYCETGSKPLVFNNKYCQTDQVASRASGILEKFISSSLPYLEATIRGKPCMKLGDKIQVISDKYRINFTGLLHRIEYTYDGTLSCKIRLVDSTILEVT